MPSFRSASPISPSSELAPRLGHPAAALAYKLALSPLLVVQALATRRRAQKLPEATGERTGFVGVIGVAPIRLLIAGDSSAAGVGVADQREAVAGYLVRTAHRAIGRPVAWQLRARSGLTTHGLHVMLEADRPKRQMSRSSSRESMTSSSRCRPGAPSGTAGLWPNGF